MFSSSRVHKRLRVWGVLAGSAAAIIALAFLPPLLPPKGSAFVMHVFAPVCHQISVRSPHIGEIQIALCDRCTGIYLGFLAGVLGVPLLWRWRRGLRRHALPMLIGATVIVGLDWIGPVLGAWPNVPLSRFLTGGLLGVVGGLLAGVGLLRSPSSPQRSVSS
jgi:uncharacterized membrane protein